MTAALLLPGTLKAREGAAVRRLPESEQLKLSAKNWPGLAGVRWNQKTTKEGRCKMSILML